MVDDWWCFKFLIVGIICALHTIAINVQICYEYCRKYWNCADWMTECTMRTAQVWTEAQAHAHLHTSSTFAINFSSSNCAIILNPIQKLICWVCICYLSIAIIVREFFLFILGRYQKYHWMRPHVRYMSKCYRFHFECLNWHDINGT